MARPAIQLFLFALFSPHPPAPSPQSKKPRTLSRFRGFSESLCFLKAALSLIEQLVDFAAQIGGQLVPGAFGRQGIFEALEGRFAIPDAVKGGNGFIEGRS